MANRRTASIRVRNFETNHLKVNDADGNPVEIAVIVVWQVADTARAVYAVDDYLDFVRVKAESALRHVATSHPYDDQTGDGSSLRGSTDVVAAELAHEVAQLVTLAGLEVNLMVVFCATNRLRRSSTPERSIRDARGPRTQTGPAAYRPSRSRRPSPLGQRRTTQPQRRSRDAAPSGPH